MKRSSTNYLTTLFFVLIAGTIFFSFPATAATGDAPAASHTITVDSTTVGPDTTFDLVIRASDLAGVDISSFTMILSYDSHLLTPIRVALDESLGGSTGTDMTLVSNLGTPGSIFLAAAGASSKPGSEALAVVTFKSHASGGVSSIAIDELSLNEGQASVAGIAGAVTIDPMLAGAANDLPTEFALEQNYPNPFNPSTSIQYALPIDSRVTLRVFDMLGREVARLVDGDQKAGSHAISFDASNLASGTYVYRIDSAEFTATRQMILVK